MQKIYSIITALALIFILAFTADAAQYRLPHHLTSAAGGQIAGLRYANRVMTLGSPLSPVFTSGGKFATRPDSGYVLSDRINNAPLLSEALVYEMEKAWESPADIIIASGPGAFTDIDRLTQWGLALTGISADSGQWQYSEDSGENWFPLTDISEENALLLSADAYSYLRFLPDGNESEGDIASLFFRAWDGSRGKSGQRTDAGNSGGTTPFSRRSGEITRMSPADGEDRDGDGLPDTWEEEQGMNPDNPDDAMQDPDEDGLINISEYINSTSPFNPDTDGDGLNDGDERKAGIDPLDAALFLPEHVQDTDKDGLPDWWEIRNEFNPADPSDAAGDRDGDGLRNIGEFINDTDPSDADTDNDAFSDGEERHNGSDPLDSRMVPGNIIADSDADGLPDWWEERSGYSASDPADAAEDRDSDGLDTSEEFTRGCNPADADSDGDQAEDGQEIRKNTDPLDGRDFITPETETPGTGEGSGGGGGCFIRSII